MWALCSNGVKIMGNPDDYTCMNCMNPLSDFIKNFDLFGCIYCSHCENYIEATNVSYNRG